MWVRSAPFTAFLVASNTIQVSVYLVGILDKSVCYGVVASSDFIEVFLFTIVSGRLQYQGGHLEMLDLQLWIGSELLKKEWGKRIVNPHKIVLCAGSCSQNASAENKLPIELSPHAVLRGILLNCRLRSESEYILHWRSTLMRKDWQSWEYSSFYTLRTDYQ